MTSEKQIFKDTSREEWMRRIEKDLKGKSLDTMDLLIDGIHFPRFVHASDQKNDPEPLGLSKTENTWNITSRIAVTDVVDANKVALAELEGGVNAIRFELKEFDKKKMPLLLDQIIPENISIRWSLSNKVNIEDFSGWWTHWSRDLPATSHSVSLDYERSYFDPISETLTIVGTENCALPDKSTAELENVILALITELMDISHEIIKSDDFQVRLIIPSGASILWEISKLRALRILAAHVALAFDLPEDRFLIETTAGQTITSMSPNDHKIATPVLALACVTGDADDICLPIPEDIEPGKELFHRRIARNVHHLLISESKMGKVIDPAAGSYFFEELTNRIAATCWESVQEKC